MYFHCSALKCLRSSLLFCAMDGRGFLQQSSRADFIWNGLKGTFQKSTPFHLLLKNREISWNLYSQKSLMSACSLFLQYFLGNTASHSQSLPHAAVTPFLLHLCSSSTTCTKCQLQNQWVCHSRGCSVILWTVTRIASSRRQSRGVSTPHLKPFKHSEWNRSSTKMFCPCRSLGATAEIGSANTFGWIRSELLQGVLLHQPLLKMNPSAWVLIYIDTISHIAWH